MCHSTIAIDIYNRNISTFSYAFEILDAETAAVRFPVTSFSQFVGKCCHGTYIFCNTETTYTHTYVRR